MPPTPLDRSESVDAVLKEAQAIDWALLRHLRGPATDVPALLTAIAKSDEDGRRHALRVLGTQILPFYDGIEGSVCELTSHVVPLLARLAAAEVAAAADILVLLRRIAQVAWDRDPFPKGAATAAMARRVLVPAQSPRSRAAAIGKVAARARGAVAALVRHFDPVAAELLYGRRAHEQLAHALPIFFSLLDSARDEVRVEAARLVERIAQSAARPDDLSIRIVTHLERERAELVVAHLVLALGHVGDRQARTLLEALLDAHDPWVRAVAAVSLSPPPMEASPRKRIAILVDALSAPEPLAERYQLATTRALHADATSALLGSEMDRQEVATQLLTLLAERRGREVPEPALEVLLEVSFPDADEPIAPSALTREQRLVLDRLGSSTERLRGRDRDFAAKLAAKGLPTDSKELARFVMVN